MGLPSLLVSVAAPLVLLQMSPSFPLQQQLRRSGPVADVKTEYVQVASASAAAVAASPAHTAHADDEERTWILENETKRGKLPNQGCFNL